MEEIKLWKIQQNTDGITEIPRQHLDLEERIHKWIEQDLSIILPNAILIGSKVRTDHNKEIDLLAIDSEGDLVIIELKKGLTPRDVVGQALDYAAWASLLREDKITELVKKHYKDDSKTLQSLFEEKLPLFGYDDINQNQKILIVGAQIDSITERIVKFLAEKGVTINVATFDFFSDGSNEFIARNFLVSDLEVQQNRQTQTRESSLAKSLFGSGKLKVGDIITYQPAIDQGKNSESIKAIVTSLTTYCLKRRNGDETLYSFSGLRRLIVKELELQGIDTDWTYSMRDEWVKDGTKLREL